MRIASLLASATEMVCALGLDSTLVAISHECDYPPVILDRPRVSRPRFDPAGLSSGAIDAAVRSAMTEHGSVYELDTEALRQAAPDLILTQDVCEVCAVPTSLAHAAAGVVGGNVRVLSLDAHSVDDILRCIQDIGEAAGIPHRAERLVAELRARIVAVHSAVAGRARPRVLALEWLDPPFAPGHWTPEMVALAGGENLAGVARERSRQVGWEDVAGLDPDVLLVMPCGYGLEASRREADAHADRLRGLAPRAVAGGRAWVLDGSAYMNRSGPRVVDGIEMLGKILHPDGFPAVQLEGRAEVWEPAPVRE
jgi:iron complex transport system substrate-binding protein